MCFQCELWSMVTGLTVVLSFYFYLFFIFTKFYFIQRNKFMRKPLGATGRPGGPSAVIPDSEYRNLSSLLETEAERNRILARNGFSSNMPLENNRADSLTPTSNSKRILSASGQRKDSGKCSGRLWDGYVICLTMVVYWLVVDGLLQFSLLYHPCFTLQQETTSINVPWTVCVPRLVDLNWQMLKHAITLEVRIERYHLGILMKWRPLACNFCQIPSCIQFTSKFNVQLWKKISPNNIGDFSLIFFWRLVNVWQK